jgi:hypothetical protein
MSTNVLQKDALGLELGNERRQVRPEMTVIARASALPGMGEGLAGVAPGEEMERCVVVVCCCADPVSDKVSLQGLDVVVLRHAGKVGAQPSSEPRVDLAEPDGRVPGPVGGECKPAVPTEEIEVRPHSHQPTM